MFRKQLIAAAVIATATMATSAQAQSGRLTESTLQDGDRKWEVTLQGAGTSDTSIDAGGFAFNGSLGYYLNDQWELILRQSFGYSDTGSDNQWTGGTRVAAQYNFDFEQDQRIIPFVGVSLGYLYGNQFSDTWAAGPEGGVKWFVNDTTFITASVAYEFFFEDAGNADDNFSDGQFVYGLGIGFQF